MSFHLLYLNAFIFTKNLHNPEVPGSNPGLATLESVENEPLTLNREWFFVCSMSVREVLREVHVISYRIHEPLMLIFLRAPLTLHHSKI